MTAKTEQAIGQNLQFLADDFASWMPRRVDSVECVDHAIARREVRVDIDLATISDLDDEGEWPRWHGDLLVPLASLSRFGGHTEMVVVDEAGALLPRLAKEEERRLALGAVEEQARHILDGEDLPDYLCHQLRSYLTTADMAVTPDAIRGTAVGDRLVDDLRFRQTLRRLSSTYYLLVPLGLDQGTRRVLTYSYYEQLKFSEPTGTRRSRLLSQIGLTVLSVSTPAAGDCASFHLVLPSPYDLQVTEANLFLEPQQGESITCHDDDRLPTRAHLYVSAATPLAEGSAEIKLHLLATGLVRSSVYSAAFTVATLVGGTAITLFADGHVFPAPNTDAAVALLLLVPGVFGSTLATPSRHSMTTKLLFPTRLTLVLASLMSFVVAAAVALNTDGLAALAIWSAASIVATTCTIILSAQLVRVRGLARDST